MKRALLFFIICFLGTGIFSNWAYGVTCNSNNNLTSAEFTLCVGGMSPLAIDGPEDANSLGSVMTVLGFISKILLYLIPTLAAFSGIIAGYYYIFSGGDSENTSRAKTIIKYNLIAIACALGSYSIILLITTLIG